MPTLSEMIKSREVSISAGGPGSGRHKTNLDDMEKVAHKHGFKTAYTGSTDESRRTYTRHGGGTAAPHSLYTSAGGGWYHDQAYNRDRMAHGSGMGAKSLDNHLADKFSYDKN